jgi:hypothetical protein
MQEAPSSNERWALIRQAIFFQLKLGLDALRDILMSPVSIVLLIVDIIMGNYHQQSYFLRLMRLGKKSDHWINLFDVELPNAKPQDDNLTADSNVDVWFTKIEEVIKEQQINGKLTQTGKEKLRQYFGRVNPPSDNTENKY